MSPPSRGVYRLNVSHTTDRPTASETAMTTTSTLSGRDRAILPAVAAGGAELQLGVEPDLLLDGRSCTEPSAAHHLVHAGYLAAVPGSRHHAGRPR